MQDEQCTRNNIRQSHFSLQLPAAQPIRQCAGCTRVGWTFNGLARQHSSDNLLVLASWLVAKCCPSKGVFVSDPPTHALLCCAAMDESGATCGKRLESIGVENTEPNRINYRELLVTAEGLGNVSTLGCGLCCLRCHATWHAWHASSWFYTSCMLGLFACQTVYKPSKFPTALARSCVLA